MKLINPYIYAGLAAESQREARRNKINSLDEVLSFICEKFDTTKESLKTKTRTHETHVYPRRIFYYLADKYTMKSKVAIGMTFRQNHATVIHSINECKKDISFVYSEQGKKYSKIEEEFKQKYNLV